MKINISLFDWKNPPITFENIQYTSNKINDFVHNFLLLWPKALFIAVPSLIKNWHHIKEAHTLFSPKLQETQLLISNIFAISPLGLDYLKSYSRVLNRWLANLKELDAEKIELFFVQEGDRIRRISTFLNQIISTPCEDGIEEGKDIISELAVSLTLIDALIEDLSTRSGVFSGGKARAPAHVLAAKAQSISVVDPASPEFEGSTGPKVKEEDADICDKDQKIPIHRIRNPFVKLHTRPLVHGYSSQSKLKPFSIPGLKSDDDFLTDFKSFKKEFPKNLNEIILEILNFIVIDIIIGIPKFIIYDLPLGLIKFQQSLSELVQSLPDQARRLVELNGYLEQMNQIHSEVEKLSAMISGLFSSVNLEDKISPSHCFSDLHKIIVSFDELILSSETSQILDVTSKIKALVFKVNPMLKKFLDTLNGRSLASIMTPNPFGRLARSKSKSDAGIGEMSSGASVSSEDSGSKAESVDGTPKASIPAAVKHIGQVFRSLFTPPPGTAESLKL